MTRTRVKQGDLLVWWIPQIPGKSFEVSVANIGQAILLLKTLADYDAFQYANHIKPDYSNAGGLVVWDDDLAADDPDGDGWSDWCNEDGEDIDEVMRK